MPQDQLFSLLIIILVSVWVLGFTILRRLNQLLNDLTERDVHASLEVDGKNELSRMDLAMLDGAAIRRHERRVKFDRVRFGYMPPVDDRGFPCWMAWKDWEERMQGERDRLLSGGSAVPGAQ